MYLYSSAYPTRNYFDCLADTELTPAALAISTVAPGEVCYNPRASHSRETRRVIAAIALWGNYNNTHFFATLQYKLHTTFA